MVEALTPSVWAADLRILEAAIEHDHCEPWHAVPRSVFRAANRRLHERIPNLTSPEIIVEFARLIALIGDGHTALHLTRIPHFDRFPVRIYRFSDGLFLHAVESHHAHLVGSRLVAIDDVPAGEIFERMRPIVSHDNAMGIWQQVPELMTIPEVLHAIGILRSCRHATFHLESPAGQRHSVLLTANTTVPDGMVTNQQATSMPVPLWLRDTGQNWTTWLPDDDAVYLAFNTVRDEPGETAASLFDRAFDLVQTHQASRFVLDLRHNGGGNKLLNEPLIHHLIRSDAVNRPGCLFVIIGRKTFSAAMNLAVDLERLTHALFVGEPTGSSPNHFGETTTVTLPNSGIRFTHSALWWQNSEPYDDRAWIEPDIPARLTSEAYFAQIDPAFAAIRGFVPGDEYREAPSSRLMRKLRRDNFI